VDGCYVLEIDVAKDHLDAQTVDARYRDLQQVEFNKLYEKNPSLTEGRSVRRCKKRLRKLPKA
jgi:hypothetical protein